MLVTEWLEGTKPRDMPPDQRCQLAKTAVKCLAMQLMTSGFIHCDPHEGNLIALPDGRVALIDFGLMAQMDRGHQEAMASGVLNIMAQNYEALVDIFKGMGVLDSTRPDLRRPGTTEDFAVALRRCMSAEGAAGAGKGGAETRRKLIQGEEGGDRRKAFGQLYEELGELAFSYYFVIPSYYILVMRAFVTLEGIALSAKDYTDFNMYTETAVYARRLLLTPQTEGGRLLLKKALFTKEGRRALRIGFRGALPASKRRIFMALILLPLKAIAAALKFLAAFFAPPRGTTQVRRP